MSWIFVAAALLGLALMWRLLGANLLGHNQKRDDLEHWVRSLLLIMEDGGLLTIEDPDSGVGCQFARRRGAGDTGAILELQIPRAPRLGSPVTELQRILDLHGFDLVCPAGGLESSHPIAIARIPVSDIWDEWSGARGAHAATLVLDALSVRSEASLEVDLVGPRINRLRARRKFLRKLHLPDDDT